MANEAMNAGVASDPLPQLPYSFARQYGICVQPGHGGAQAIYRQGLSLCTLAEVRRFIGMKLACTEVSADVFEQALAKAYQHETGMAQKFADDAGEELSLERVIDSVETGDLLAQEDDAPVIRLINALLMEALRENASDIHIEPFERELVVRLRVDGILQETLKLKPILAPLLISRIKVMARLDIAEKRLPQDGRISLRLGNREIDVRVSTLPSGLNERVVLRLLDKQAGRLDLEQLGLAQADIQSITAMIHRPHGIILITGPTGSGKTTTLYAMLSRINDRSRNILTIEDPIEYQVAGVGQTQVNMKIELTFARGLRAMLRQDPDVVMIGEIRDVETARIAVQASLTGHLVLSTLHTNSAVGAVTRLIDMGVEPFLLASSLAGLLAQRLVRRLCPQCSTPSYATASECAFLGMDVEWAPVIHHAAGCSACRNTGYKGRVAIYEIITVNETMRGMVHAAAAEQALETHARASGPGMLDDGRAKILQGITTCEEVMRVTSE
jgi:general secretion pathway protein E